MTFSQHGMTAHQADPAIPRIPTTQFVTLPIEWHEENIFKDFKRLSASLIDKIPKEDWEYLAFARHHRLLT